MRLHRAVVILLFLPLSLLLQGTFSSTAAAPRDDGPKLLAQIDRESNPIKKAKLEVRLARLRLNEALDAYTNGHYDDFWKLLAVYADYMQRAWADLQASGKIAYKRSDGFKQLDIGLRESRRELEDFQTHITFDERQEVKKIQTRMDDIHSQVLNALFPQPSVKKKKSDSSGQPAEDKN